MNPAAPPQGARRVPGTVLRSVNGPGDTVCMDLFRRTDGTFGYEMYRRDAEDGRGWFSIGGFAKQVYPTADAAWQDALQRVGWLGATAAGFAERVE